MYWGNSRRPLVMGILNVTPDSFSGDGKVNVDQALAQAIRFASEGADIIDIGGESTRPDAKSVSADEEIARVAPVVARIRQHLDIPISIDTMKASVAEAALSEGADIINDVTGGRGDAGMLNLAADNACPVILMHNRASWQVAHGDNDKRAFNAPIYENFMADMIRELGELKADALAAGIEQGNIILDPGVGFGKSDEQNLQIIRDLREFDILGCPLLVGASRKSFIGRTLDLPPEDRLEGTAAAVALAVANGAAILRVHDVKEMRRVVDMANAIGRQ